MFLLSCKTEEPTEFLEICGKGKLRWALGYPYPVGLHLDEKTRDEVKRIKTRISDLSTTFTFNLNEENTVLEFSVEELAGVPQDLVDSFEKVWLDHFMLRIIGGTPILRIPEFRYG